MFALPRHPYAPPYQSYYNPYEQLLLEQELKRQRRAEAYRRRQLEIEQLNRRQQYEYARRQAELQRPRQAEMEMEREARRRAIDERAREHRRSVLGGMEDLFDMLYGGRVMSTPPQGRPSPFDERRASPSPPVRPERTDATTEEVNGAVSHLEIYPDQVSIIQRVLTARDTSLSAESTKQTTDSLTAPPDELESGSARTGETETHQPDTVGSHAAVAGILTTFASLSSNFAFPSHLDFSSPSSSDSPKLAYTSNNGPLHQYEHELTGLLTQLDAVESYGDEGVRKARKEAVKRIEQELAALDERKMDEWRKQNSPEMELGVEQQTKNEVSEVDATKIPLPEDLSDEDGRMNVAGCELSTAPLSSMHSSSPHTFTPHEHAEIGRTSLEETSSSDDSDSEVEDYVDVEADVVSISETEKAEETEIEQERDLVGSDEWEMDF
ncbi:hypothetical protein FRC08_004423 [Ceratobasidium sp. 394]|nr:hypothetical protein FRC08_004423 [Ceratobasidium sp. 394]